MNAQRNLLAILFTLQSIYGVADYPLISFAVSSRDSLYNQQQQDLEAWYSKAYSPDLSIYKYQMRFGEDIFSLAAAFNLPYDGIATINGWESPGSVGQSDYVLIPNIPGIFVAENPQNNWGKRMKDSRENKKGEIIQVNRNDGSTLKMLFYAGDKFTKEERIHFLSSKFIMPIKNYYVTSQFGYRRYFLNGKRHFHTGIDLGAPPGTPIMASRKGRVNRIGKLRAFGTYAAIEHEGGYETFYSHLSKVLVNVNEEVSAGQIIALSGNSGISTGPHLHFEIRRNGIPVDPMSLID